MTQALQGGFECNDTIVAVMLHRWSDQTTSLTLTSRESIQQQPPPTCARRRMQLPHLCFEGHSTGQTGLLQIHSCVIYCACIPTWPRRPRSVLCLGSYFLWDASWCITQTRLTHHLFYLTVESWCGVRHQISNLNNINNVLCECVCAHYLVNINIKRMVQKFCLVTWAPLMCVSFIGNTYQTCMIVFRCILHCIKVIFRFN